MMRFFRVGMMWILLIASAPIRAADAGPSSAPQRPAAPKGLSPIPAPIPKLALIAFVDERTLERHRTLLGEWALEVAREGNFAVEWVRRPRVETWTSPNRVEATKDMLRMVQERKPAAVMFWGAVGWMATGSSDPDGHGPRVAWTDVPFASDFNDWTDTRDFGITYSVSLGQNVPGDGKWDKVFNAQAGIRARRSVGRVDFSNLRSAKEASDVDEDDALEDYLRRNLAYRRGEGFSKEVVILASLMGPSDREWLAKNISGREVSDIPYVDYKLTYPVAGRRFFAMYTSIVPYLREGFRDGSGTMTATLWAVILKSYATDPWNVAETQRQYLRQSLVVTFGGRHWVPNGGTVHEAYLGHSYPGRSALVSEDTLLGDVTLKLK